MPCLKKLVRADSLTLSSRADLADVTISFALHTVLIDASDRFDASRYETRVSRAMSVSSCEWDWELDGESEDRLF